MSIPMVKHATIFAGTETASVTKEFQSGLGDMGQAFLARSVILETSVSTSSWTLAIQGKVSASATWHNIDFYRIDQGGGGAISATTLTVNWTSPQYYVIPNPPPFLRLVGTRTGGFLTVYGAFSTEAFAMPPGVAAGALSTVSIDQTTPGTTNKVALTTQGYSAAVTLTRTADTNGYVANDVIGAATGSTAALTFSTVGPSGSEILITSVALQINQTGIISGQTSYRLYLYNVTPPSAYGDNVAWDILTGDRASYLGYVDLGTPVDLGGTLYVQTDQLNRQIKLTSANLFGYLVTNGAYTPESATVHVIMLHSVAP